MMRVLVVGGSGLIGKGIVKMLRHFNHEVLIASRSSQDVQVDLSNHESIEKMYESLPNLDAVISVPGSHAKMGPVSELSKKDFIDSLQIKCLGQIDLVLTGQKYLNPKGSFTLTTGILSTEYPPLVSCISTINNAVEGFVKCAAFELLNQLRLNVVSPNLIEEAADKIGDYFKGFKPVPLKDAALAYIRSVEGVMNGKVLKVW